MKGGACPVSYGKKIINAITKLYELLKWIRIHKNLRKKFNSTKTHFSFMKDNSKQKLTQTAYFG